MAIRFATPDARRAYWRAAYWRNRDAINAKHRAAYRADPVASQAKNRASYLRNRTQLLAHQAIVRAANADTRRARDRERYRIRHYGTPDPQPGQPSLDGTRHFMDYGKRLTCPKPPAKPKPSVSSASPTNTAAATRRFQASSLKPRSTRPSPSASSSTASPPSSKSLTPSTPPAPPSAPWIPTPVNTEIQRTPHKPNVYLCTCNAPFPTAGAARQHERTHKPEPISAHYEQHLPVHLVAIR